MNIKALAHFYFVILILFSAASWGQLGSRTLSSSSPKFSHQYTFFESDKYYFVDTSFNDLHWYHQFDHTNKDNYDYSTLGSMGNPMNRLTSPVSQDIWNYNGKGAYSPYFKTLKDIPFYQTRSPITEANYWMGYDRGQSFGINHTQNINDHWNFLIGYKRLNDLGYYEHNRNIQSSFIFNSNYRGKGGYNFHLYYLNEKLNTEENGGIAGNPALDSLGQPILYEVNLTNDARELRNREFFIDQNLDLAKLFGVWRSLRDTSDNQSSGAVDSLMGEKEPAVLAIGYTFKYTGSYNKYEGVAPTDLSEAYYDNYYNVTDGEYTDSVHYRSYENTVYLKGEVGNKTRLNVKGGIKNILTEYSGYNYLLVNNGLGITGQLSGRLGELINVRSEADYIFTGNLKQSIDIKAMGELKPLEWLKAFGGYQYTLKYPDYFEQFYYSNNYIWQNRLERQGVNRLWYGIGWGKNNRLQVNNEVYSNYTYYNEDVQPTQSDENVLVLKAELTQNFEFWDLVHFDNRVTFQKVGGNAEVMPLPEWHTRNALYFEFHLFKKALKCLAGAEMNYFTEYYSPSYNPAIGRFYVADEFLIGNYPLMDVFATFKLNTARIFFKYEHINQGLMASSNYYAAPHYAFPGRKFRIGITWRFFN